MAAAPVVPAFRLRPGHSGDLAFVYSSWLGGDRFSRAGQMCSHVYAAEHEQTAKEILQRSGVFLRVACLPDDEDALLGWSVTTEQGARPCVFYVYVKRGVRRQGLAAALIGAMAMRRCDYSHQPVVHGEKRDGVFVPLCPPPGWTFNPYRNFR